MLSAIYAPQGDRALPGIIEDQAGKHDQRHQAARIRPLAEMAHVGIERLRTGHAQKNTAEHEKAAQSALGEEMQALIQIDGAQNRGILCDAPEPERSHGDEPQHHDRAERRADA